MISFGIEKALNKQTHEVENGTQHEGVRLILKGCKLYMYYNSFKQTDHELGSRFLFISHGFHLKFERQCPKDHSNV